MGFEEPKNVNIKKTNKAFLLATECGNIQNSNTLKSTLIIKCIIIFKFIPKTVFKIFIIYEFWNYVLLDTYFRQTV